MMTLSLEIGWEITCEGNKPQGITRDVGQSPWPNYVLNSLILTVIKTPATWDEIK
jgi:hypothetical protein